MVALEAEPSVLPLQTITCIICDAPTPPGNATAGSTRFDSGPAFACTMHLRERRTWFMAWSAFESKQRHVRKSAGQAQ